MQTNFTPEQLADPAIKEADRILRRCVHCGLCTSVCSSYVVLGDERDSPRGRIYLIKDMLEREPREAPTPEIRTHLDRCLTCLSCTSTCPSGVDYMHLVDIARSRIEKRLPRGMKDRFLRALLANVLTSPRRFSWALKAAPMGRPFTSLLRRLGLSEIAAMIELAPKSLLAPPPAFRARARPKRSLSAAPASSCSPAACSPSCVPTSTMPPFASGPPRRRCRRGQRRGLLRRRRPASRTR